MASGASPRRSDFQLAPFRVSDDRLAWWQVLSTLLPTALLWLAIPRVTQAPQTVWLLLPVLSLLVLFSARSFSLMHDCGHGSLFQSRWLNRAVGFGFGCLNAIPQYPWSRGHAFHHKHNGNWELYRGPSALLTKEQFLGLSASQRRRYALTRHPLMLFPGGFSYLVIRPRLQLLLGSIEWAKAYGVHLAKTGLPGLAGFHHFNRTFRSSHWYTTGEFVDLLFNNIVVVLSWLLMGAWLGHGLFWLCYATVMTCSAAIFICIFFVQHNFQGSYAHGSDDWSYFRGAIDGSSNLVMPAILNWFSADIAYHSIHHLCERIPNYRLKACHAVNAHLINPSSYLRLSQIPNCFKLILWDQKARELISVKQALSAV